MAEEKKEWKREFSAGGVVYKKDNSLVFILMINPKSRNYGPAEDYWSFPKGHAEEGETMQQAALREVKEETGITASIEENIGTSKYSFKWGEDNIFKIVSYYLMKYESGEPVPEEEVANVEWVKLDNVLSRLKFGGDKEIFERAKEKLLSS